MTDALEVRCSIQLSYECIHFKERKYSEARG